MGFQYRKRTKGKNAWLNFSASKKRGIGGSASIKLGRGVTYNTRGRLTINFGNGMRYVAYKKKPRVKKVDKVKAYVEPKTRGRPKQVKTYSVNELLCLNQKSLVMMGSYKAFRNSSNLQVLLDVHNAIEDLKQDRNSMEVRDLIIVTTNQLSDVAKQDGNQGLIECTNIIRDYLRSVLPNRPKPIVEKKGSALATWIILIGFSLIVAMCSA